MGRFHAAGAWRRFPGTDRGGPGADRSGNAEASSSGGEKQGAGGSWSTRYGDAEWRPHSLRFKIAHKGIWMDSFGKN